MNHRVLERALAFLVLSGGACTCGEDGVVGRVVPRIEVSTEPLDFGEVPIGLTKRLSIDVSNPGAAALTLNALMTMPPFSAKAVELRVEAGSTTQIDVAFAPSDEGKVQGTLQILSNAEGMSEVTVDLSGTGVPGFVEVSPRTVDFSNTNAGTSKTIELVIDNRGLQPVSGPIVPQRFARPDAYQLGSANLMRPGMFAAAARDTTRLVLEYRPFVVGDDSGRLLFELCGEGCGLEVDVLASAVSAAIRLDPGAIDFGAVGIGQSKTEVVTVWNDGTKAIDIGRVRTLGSAETTVTSARATPTTLAAGSSLILTVEYKPQAATEMLSTLSVETSDEAVREARVRLTGRGAGPLFQVTPSLIDFGVVRRTTAQRRSFVLLNAGSAEVTVTRIAYAGHSSMRVVGGPGLPARLGPGETFTPSVELVPTGTTGRFLGEVTVATDDPSHREVQIPVTAAFSETACQIDVIPGRINFGLVTPPYSRKQQAVVTNRGDRPCVILNGAFAAPTDPAFSIGPVAWPVSLGVGQSVALEFGYAPVDARESKSNFVLTTDDAAFPERLITVVGSSQAYEDLFVVPTHIDFGALEPACITRPQNITIFNAGTLDAELQSIQVTGSPEVTPDAMTFPQMLRAGSSKKFEYRYGPQDLGVDQGEIQINVRDRQYPMIVSWRGEGAPSVRATDHFEQGLARPVDVLFVVDDSCSMSEEQNALAMNFSDFIRTANVRSVDFRIAVTTTDVTGGMAGQLRGPILSPRTPNLETDFQGQALPGTNGSGFEQGLEAMDAVFGRLRGRTTDFLRSGVTLVVIIISDEEDSSPGSPVTYFNSLRSVSHDTFVAVITGQATGCSAPLLGSADPAPKYEAFVALTSGLSLSICAPWSTTLSNLGAVVFGLKQAFELQVPPDRSVPIEVRVNGMVVPSTTWHYDANTKSIVFEATSIPPEGASIDVTYEPAC